MAEWSLSRELLPPGARVLCAVSGGADSVCLLRAVWELGDVACACAHYNHGLRGAASDGDETFVKALCDAWGIPFFSERGDVAALAQARGESLETAARLARYDFLERAAERWGADVIATAHNLSDNVETVLFRLARGTGLRGLTGIPERRGRIVRPLLHVSREEILAYLAERELPHREDETNALDDCARNYARHHLLPALEQLHGGALDNVDRMTRNLAEDEAYLAAQAAAWLASQEPEALSAAVLAALPRPVARRALDTWLGKDLSRERFEAVLRFCLSPSGAVLELPGRKLYRWGDKIALVPPERRILPSREIEGTGTLLLPEAGARLSCRLCEAGQEIQTSFNIFSFSCAKICGRLTVSARAEGDRIRLLGREGVRSVKKLMNGAGIPRWEREAVPVLRDDNGPLAVYGFGQAEGTLPRPGEAFYQIEIIKTEEPDQ